MKKAVLISCVVLMFFAFELTAQHFIGLSKEDTKVLARKSGYYPDEITKSQVFNYLKFVNSVNTKTLIVFFSEDDISQSCKIVCDYSEFDFVLDENKKNFKTTGKNKWEYKVKDESFEVLLEEQEWYFVQRVKKM
jgi:hypothetical protein